MRERAVLEQLQKEAKEASAGLCGVELERDELKAKLQVAEQSLRDQAGAFAAEGHEKVRQLEAELAEMRKSKETLELSREEYCEQLQSSKAECLRLEQSCRTAEERSEQHEETLLRERAVLEQLQTQATEAGAARLRIETDRDELKAKLQVVEQSLRDQAGAFAAEGDEKVVRLQAALTEVQKSNEDLELKKKDLSEQLQLSKAESLRWEEACRTAEERSTQHEETLLRERAVLEQLQTQATEAGAARLRIERERDELKAKMQVVEQSLRDQAGAFAAEGDEKVVRLQAALTEVQKSNEDLELKKKDLSEQLQLSKAESLRWEEACRTAEERSTQHEETLLRERAVLEQLQTQATEAGAARLRIERERDELKAKLQVVEQSLRDQAGAFAAEGDEKVVRLQAALTEVQKSNEDLELTKKDLSDQLRLSKAESLRWEQACRTAEERSSSREEALLREITELKAKQQHAANGDHTPGQMPQRDEPWLHGSFPE